MFPSPADKAARSVLKPRKIPSQDRAVHTVDAILQAAIELLERSSFDEYNTNEIAIRAGASIGSVYQYFPGKDAITVALIERESHALVAEVESALARPDRSGALRAFIDVAVNNQFRRPKLARLLDFEQTRLAAILPASSNAAAITLRLAAFLRDAHSVEPSASEEAAADVMSIVRALTDGAGNRERVNQDLLRRQIEGAIAGYLESFTPE